jgi:predicted nuclease of restriction endonuclease-like RecB superfamily
MPSLQNENDWTVVYQTIDNTLSGEEGEVVDNLRVALEDDKRLVDTGKMTNDEFLQEWYNSFEAAAVECPE